MKGQPCFYLYKVETLNALCGGVAGGGYFMAYSSNTLICTGKLGRKLPSCT
jgi:hypothetical protein